MSTSSLLHFTTLGTLGDLWWPFTVCRPTRSTEGCVVCVELCMSWHQSALCLHRDTEAHRAGQWVLIVVSVWVCLCFCRSYLACKLWLFCTTLLRHLWPLWLYHVLLHYLLNDTIFWPGGEGDLMLNTKCVFWSYVLLLSETFLILRRIQRTVTTNVHISVCCTVPLCLLDINQTWIFWTGFRKILKYKISWKSFQIQSDCVWLFHGATQTWLSWSSLVSILRTRRTIVLVFGGQTGWRHEKCHMSVHCETDSTASGCSASVA